MKCTHDSGGLVICRDKSVFDKENARKKIERSLKRNYFWYGREWPYKNVKPRILAEVLYEETDEITADSNESDISCEALQKKQGLLDYKFMCFNGEVKALFLDIGVIGSSNEHALEYYRNIYDKHGILLPVKETRENYPVPIRLPDNLDDMIAIAEKLSVGIPHVRVDLYRFNNGDIKVGEMTFYHGSGLSNQFFPECWDYTFGSWIDLPIETN